MVLSFARPLTLLALAAVAAAESVQVYAVQPKADEQGVIPAVVQFQRTGTNTGLSVFYRITGTGLSDLHGGHLSDAVVEYPSRGDGYVSSHMGAIPVTGAGVIAPGTGALGEPVIEVSIPGGRIASITVTDGGSGYAVGDTPTVTIIDAYSGSDGGGSGATAEAVVRGAVQSVSVTAGGIAYVDGEELTFTDGNPIEPARVRLNVNGSGAVTSITVIDGGSGYAAAPSELSPPSSGSGILVASTLTFSVAAVNLQTQGSGYIDPRVAIAPPSAGVAATADAVLEGSPLDHDLRREADLALYPVAGEGLRNTAVLSPGYQLVLPTAAVMGAAATAAVVRVVAYDGGIERLVVESGGSGYATPAVVLPASSGSATAGSATVRIDNGELTMVRITGAGAGNADGQVTVPVSDGNGGSATIAALVVGGKYVSAWVLASNGSFACPTIAISGTGAGAAGTLAIEDGQVVSATLTASGSGYALASAQVDDPNAPSALVGAETRATVRFEVCGPDYYVIPEGIPLGGYSSAGSWIDPATGDLMGSLFLPVGQTTARLLVVPQRNGVGGARDLLVSIEPDTGYVVDELSAAQVRLGDRDDESVLVASIPTGYPSPTQVDPVPYPIEVDGRAEAKLTVSGNLRDRRLTTQFDRDGIRPRASIGQDADCLLVYNVKSIPDTAGDFVVALNAEAQPPIVQGPAQAGDTVIPVSATLANDLVVMFEGPGAATRVAGIYVVTGSSKGTDELNPTITITPALNLVDCVAGQTRVRVLGRLVPDSASTDADGTLLFNLYTPYPTLYLFAFPYMRAVPRGARSLAVRVVETDDFRVRNPTNANLTIADTSVVARLLFGANAGQPSSGGYAEVRFSAAFPIDVTVPFSILDSSTALLTVPDDPNTLANESQPNDAVITGATPSTKRGSILIKAGVTTGRINVTPSGSNARSGNVAFDLRLDASPDYQFGPSGSAAANSQTQIVVAPVPLTHNGAPVRIAFNASTLVPAAEPSTHGQITISLVDAAGAPLVGDYLDAPVAVAYSATGSAVAGVNYQTLDGLVTMPQGAASVVVPVQVIDDGVATADLSVVLTLGAGAGYQVGTTATATIPLTDGSPRLAIETVQAAIRPGARAGTPGQFRVRNARPVSQPVTVTYAVSGSAVAGTDFTALPGSVTLSPGADTVAIDVVPLVGDGTAKDVIVTLGNSPAPATFLVTTATATLAIQAAARPVNTSDQAVYISAARVANGAESPLADGSFRVFFSNIAGVELGAGLDVDYPVTFTLGGTAVEGINYGTVPRTVTIPARATAAIVAIPVINDGVVGGTQVDVTIPDNMWPSAANAASVLILADTSSSGGGSTGTPRPPSGGSGGSGCGVGSGLGLVLAGLGMVLAVRLRRRRGAA